MKDSKDFIFFFNEAKNVNILTCLSFNLSIFSFISITFEMLFLYVSNAVDMCLFVELSESDLSLSNDDRDDDLDELGDDKSEKVFKKIEKSLLELSSSLLVGLVILNVLSDSKF
jgi:hypothetical protein